MQRVSSTSLRFQWLWSVNVFIFNSARLITCLCRRRCRCYRCRLCIRHAFAAFFYINSIQQMQFGIGRANTRFYTFDFATAKRINGEGKNEHGERIFCVLAIDFRFLVVVFGFFFLMHLYASSFHIVEPINIGIYERRKQPRWETADAESKLQPQWIYLGRIFSCNEIRTDQNGESKSRGRVYESANNAENYQKRHCTVSKSYQSYIH